MGFPSALSVSLGVLAGIGSGGGGRLEVTGSPGYGYIVGETRRPGEDTAIDDSYWVARAAAGSEEGCREIVRRYERPVFGLVLRMVKDPAVAEELAQEVFLKALRSLESYDASRKLSSWLFKIAHNTAIDHLRRKRVEGVSLDARADDERGWSERLADPSVPSPEAEAERSDLAAALEGAIARLRPEYREVIVLRFQEGLAYGEISEVTGLPLGTVKTYIFRARNELAGILSGQGWGPEGAGARGGDRREDPETRPGEPS